MGDRWAVMLLVFWLLPLGLLSGVVILGHVVRVSWRQRGLEQGSLYCAGCRFNLTGCASWNCPECGAHLDDGRIMTPGHDPPVGLLGRVLLATVGVAGPLVLGCWLLAWVVPANHETNRTLELRPQTDSFINNVSQIEVQGYGEVTWFGRGRPESMYLEVSRLHDFARGRRLEQRYEQVLPSEDDDLLPDRLWSRVQRQCNLDDESEDWRAEARAELVVAMRYVAGEMELPRLGCFHVQEQTFRRFEPRGWVVFVEALLAVLVWGLLLWAVMRGYGRACEDFALRHERLVDELHGWIVENRAAAGISVASRENSE